MKIIDVITKEVYCIGCNKDMIINGLDINCMYILVISCVL